MTAPQIETERLILRAHRRADFEDSFAMWSDPQVVEFISGTPSTRQQAWNRVVTYAGSWALLGFGYWLVSEKATGAFVGEAGVADFHRDIDPALAGIPEAGWVFATRAHGRGLATEAVRAVLAWCDETLGASLTICLVDPRNAASIRVAQKCGYRETRRGLLNGQPCVFFERSVIPKESRSIRG
jgi:RimJ/RimL family protein N-acetyltransferase